MSMSSSVGESRNTEHKLSPLLGEVFTLLHQFLEIPREFGIFHLECGIIFLGNEQEGFPGIPSHSGVIVVFIKNKNLNMSFMGFKPTAQQAQSRQQSSHLSQMTIVNLA